MNVIIEPMRPDEIPAVSAIMGKTFATNPMNITVLGPNQRRNEGLMRIVLERFPGQTFVAKNDGQIVGAMRMVEWPNCQPPPSKMLPILPIIFKTLGWRITKVFK